MKKRPFEIENPTDTHRAIWKWWSGWISADFGMHPVAAEKLIEAFIQAGWVQSEKSSKG